MQWCLNIHAPYRCRHAGACCRASWMIPFEDGTIAARDAQGACTFLDGTNGLCSIHRAGGVHALPLTCRMFPRIVLKDGRGTFISLSHFCPTAASLLFEACDAIAIVEAPAALANIGELDGLDARQVWPPLLRPGVLMDLESYGEWERRALSILTRDDAAPRDALAALADATARLTAWTPGSGALLDTVHAAFDALGTGAATDAVRERAAVKRWLAARLFGAWMAYQGDGLAATIAYLRTCLETFDREVAADGSALEAIRRSDLRIVHG
jgi:Fe-S-cluster containining protein